MSLYPPGQELGEGMDALGFGQILGVEDEEAVEVAVTYVSYCGSGDVWGGRMAGHQLDTRTHTHTPAPNIRGLQCH